ncbi:MAG: hypothetical protein UZ15_CFX003002762 [Chloroflexi bacterium OLB15]|nr:MAG: hypothetical protein UZ15_CFX003002762 [Chloroflexi bacterium OLB15]
MKKLAIFMLLLGLAAGAQAQETTPEPTAEAAQEATPEVTSEADSEATPEATAEVHRITAPGYYTVQAGSGGVNRRFLLSIPVSYFNGAGAPRLFLRCTGQAAQARDMKLTPVGGS